MKKTITLRIVPESRVLKWRLDPADRTLLDLPTKWRMTRLRSSPPFRMLELKNKRPANTMMKRQRQRMPKKSKKTRKRKLALRLKVPSL